MSAPVPAVRVLRFDTFELDLRAGELHKHGVKLRLQGQPVQLLAILLQSAGNLVTREELRSQLWPADTFVDFDHSLHNAIGRIREALGDSAEIPRYIETLPRRGYRFIAPVEEVQAPRISEANGNKTREGVAVPPPPARQSKTRAALALRLQNEVAQAIAQQVRAQLTPQQQARFRSAGSVNPDAYEAYLRGRYYLSNQFTMGQPLNTAKSYFEESIRKDPDFALAYSGLADSYVYLAFFRQLSPEAAYKPAKEALRKALELDDSIGEAHDTLGQLSWRFEWNLDAAEREFNRAIALAPSYSCAHEDRSVFLGFTGRRAEALAEIA